MKSYWPIIYDWKFISAQQCHWIYFTTAKNQEIKSTKKETETIEAETPGKKKVLENAAKTKDENIAKTD